MEKRVGQPERPISIVLLTAAAGVGILAIVLHQQGDPMGKAILDVYRQWGFGFLVFTAGITLAGGGPGVEGQRIELALRWMVMALINWGGWTYYGR